MDQKLVNTASVQQKIEHIHGLARDEEVAVRVATDLLRRPQVAERSMRDDLAKHMVNRAQASTPSRPARWYGSARPPCPASSEAATSST